MNFTLCPDATPHFLGLFDPTIAPPLLFYAYIPIFLLSIIFGFVVLVKDRYSLQAKYFWAMNMSFAAWILLIIFQWIAVDVEVVHLAWQLLLVPEISIFLFAIYFSYEFLFKKEPIKFFVYVMALSFVGMAILLPTVFNVEAFDLNNCEGVIGMAWNYIYIFEIASLCIIGLLCFEKLRISLKKKEKISSIFVPIGLMIFLGIFWASNFFAEIIKFYEINLIGPIGMAVFMSFLTYAIVKFKAFNIKLFTSQAFVFTLWILMGSLLFIQNVNVLHAVIACTLLLVSFIGYELIKSVKKEIEQREKIERLASDLQKSNEGQTNLIHIMNHQIKGYLAKARGIFSELMSEPAYGPISEVAKPMIKEGFESLTEGVGFVQQVLNGSSAESGTLVYSMKQVDVRTLVEEVSSKEKEKAEKKGLTFDVTITDGNYTANADAIHIKEAVRNLIENSIIYTPTGGLTIHLEHKNDKIVFSVKDTGLGIAEEDKVKLFTKGGRGKDSLKVNVNSTGYGLAFVKGVAEAHKGRVWVESEGTGKGSTFYLELQAQS